MLRSDRLALAFRDQVLSLPATGRVVVLRAEPSPFLDLVPAERLHCIQTFRPMYDALGAEGRTVAKAPTGRAAMVVVNLTRSRAETLGNVAAALDMLDPGGTLVLSGAKTDGIDALARQLAACLTIAGTFVKAHGRVVWLARPPALPDEVSGWAEAARPSRNAAGFVTAPGMFSPEHPDPGSERLAAILAGRLAGRVADLGAGWGWLAHAALKSCPDIEILDLYEAEDLALDAARVNVGDPRAGFHWSDVTALGLNAPRYDAVISNPPFHRGRAADPDVGFAFIAAAGRILKPDGRLFLVANRQLPYESTLDATFRQVSRLGEGDGYKVLMAERPRRA